MGWDFSDVPDKFVGLNDEFRQLRVTLDGLGAVGGAAAEELSCDDESLVEVLAEPRELTEDELLGVV